MLAVAESCRSPPHRAVTEKKSHCTEAPLDVVFRRGPILCGRSRKLLSGKMNGSLAKSCDAVRCYSTRTRQAPVVSSAPGPALVLCSLRAYVSISGSYQLKLSLLSHIVLSCRKLFVGCHALRTGPQEPLMWSMATASWAASYSIAHSGCS